MESRHYLLPSDTQPRLELVCGTHWRYVHIRMDGTQIGSIGSASDLLRGAEFFLPDGGVLAVKLIKQVGASELRVMLNGRALTTSGLDRANGDVRTAYQAILAIGAVNLLFFCLTLLSEPSSPHLRWFDLVFGLTFLFLGWLVREGSSEALTVALAIYGIDALITVNAIFNDHDYLAIFDLSLNLMLLFFMLQGYGSPRKALDSVRLLIGRALGGIDPSSARKLRADEPIRLPDDLKRVQDLLRRAVRLYAANKKRERARLMVKEALQIAPSLADGWYVLAYMATRSHDRLRALDRVLAIDPFHAGAQDALDKLRRKDELGDQWLNQATSEALIAQEAEPLFSDLAVPTWTPDMTELLRVAKPTNSVGGEGQINRMLVGVLIVIGGLIVVVLVALT